MRVKMAQHALYVMYLPLNTNDGAPQPQERLTWALTEIAHFAGGYTLFPVSEGAWVNPRGNICYERIQPIWVVASASSKDRSFFFRLASVLARILEQEEIFVHLTPVTVVHGVAEQEGALLWKDDNSGNDGVREEKSLVVPLPVTVPMSRA